MVQTSTAASQRQADATHAHYVDRHRLCDGGHRRGSGLPIDQKGVTSFTNYVSSPLSDLFSPCNHSRYLMHSISSLHTCALLHHKSSCRAFQQIFTNIVISSSNIILQNRVRRSRRTTETRDKATTVVSPAAPARIVECLHCKPPREYRKHPKLEPRPSCTWRLAV